MGVCLCLLLNACADKWADHIGSTEQQKNLYEIVKERAEFSAFAQLLEQSGYAEDLKASKNYTLIIPTNTAIDAVKANYNFTDTAVLRGFVGYHIVNSVYSLNETADTVLAQNFRGKYIEMLSGKFDEVAPTTVNQVAGNGIYHVVGSALTPLENIMLFVRTHFADTEQVKAVISLDTPVVVDTRLVTNVDPTWFQEGFQPMVREDRKFTYFVVDDAYYTTEYAKLKSFYTTDYAEGGRRPDSTTTFFTKKALLRDYLVEGEYNSDELPSELLSLTGTKFHVDPQDVISTHKTSNGRVIRIKKLSYALADQIKEVKVLGIEPTGFRQNDKSGNTYYRNKRDLNGELYNDIEIHGHAVTAFYAKYNAQHVNAIRYKVYGRAIMGLPGDPQTTAFTQYVHFLDPALTSINEVDRYKRAVVNYLNVNDTRMTFNVGILNQAEVYLGEVSQGKYGNLPLLVMSNTTGPIILEYLRFVPILP